MRVCDEKTGEKAPAKYVISAFDLPDTDSCDQHIGKLVKETLEKAIGYKEVLVRLL